MLLATTSTASDGLYLFNSLQVAALVPNGVYIIAVERTQSALAGLVQVKLFLMIIMLLFLRKTKLYK